METPYEAAQGADLVVILTEWNEFRALDLSRLARKMAVAAHGRSAQHLFGGRGEGRRFHRICRSRTVKPALGPGVVPAPAFGVLWVMKRQ